MKNSNSVCHVPSLTRLCMLSVDAMANGGTVRTIANEKATQPL